MSTTEIQRGIYDLATSMEPLHAVGFAGGGGSSRGYHLAGARVHVALNHNRAAMAMHRINHQEALHFIEDIRTVDPRVACGGRKLRSAWFSPDCRDFSKAKQGKPKSKRIRGLAWVIIHWVNQLGPLAPDVIFLENVEEFAQWCPLLPDGSRNKALLGWFFRCFVGALRRRGYVVEWREQRACDYGAPTIRKRLFLVARRDGQPIVWPEPTHGDPESEAVKAGRLLPYRTAAECIDFWRPCPSIFLTRPQARALKRRTGIQVKRPLAKASLRRIAVGVGRHVMKSAKPFLVCLTHQGNDGVESVGEPFKTITGANRGERALVVPVLAGVGGRAGQSRPRAGDEPMGTVTSKGDTALAQVSLAAPFLTEHGNGSVQRNLSAAEPLRTQCAAVKGGHFALVSAVLVPRYGERPGQAPRARAVTEPMATVVNTGNGASLVSVFLAQHNTGVIGHEVHEPMSSVTGTGSQQAVVACSLVKYYGADQDPQMSEPMHSVTTHDRFGFVQSELIPMLTPELAVKARRVAKFLRRFGVEFEGEFATVDGLVIVDIGMRMLVPRELFRAQGFADDYVIDKGWFTQPDGSLVERPLSGKEQVKMCGNSVSPLHARAIVRANLSELQEARAA